jgi:hypothetical protein
MADLSDPENYYTNWGVLKFFSPCKLKTGDKFGELGLLKGCGQPRAATITCSEDTHFGILFKKDY